MPAAAGRGLAGVRGGGEPVLQGRGQAPHDRRDGGLLPRTPHRARDVHGRHRARDGRAAHLEPGNHRRRAREQRHHDRLREHRPAQGQARRARGAAADRGRRHPRLQVPPDLPGLLSRTTAWPTGSTRSSPSTGCRRSSTADTRGSAPACRGGGGLEAQVFEPDPPRRRRGGLSGHEDHHRAPVMAVAGRGALGVHAQAERLHRPLGLVAEVFPAAARAVRQQRSSGAGCCSARTSR